MHQTSGASLRRADENICPYVAQLRYPHRFSGERRSDALRRFSLQARTQQLSCDAQSIQKLCVDRRKFAFN